MKPKEDLRATTQNGRLVPKAFRPPKVPDLDEKGEPKAMAVDKGRSYAVTRDRTPEEAQAWWDGLDRPKKLLTKGNKKLGEVYHTDLPAGASCPGESKFCDGCYAKNAHYRYPSIKTAYAKNMKFLLQDPEGYGSQLSKEVSALPAGKAFRPHTSGDIMDVPHAEALKKVARENPDRPMFLYTRSWRDSEIRPHVDEIAQMPNVTVNYSTDAGIEPEFKKLEQEHPLPTGPRMQAHAEVDHDEGAIKQRADIRRQETGRTSFICPEQTGRKPSCEACMLCHKRKPGSVVQFKKH